MVQEEKSRTTKRRKEKGEDFFAFVRDIISIVCLYPSRVSIFNYDLLEVQKSEDFDKTNRRHHNSFFFVCFLFQYFYHVQPMTNTVQKDITSFYA